MDLLPNLHETFCNLRTNCIMLNPKKCVFGINDGKLIGFMVSHQGIEVNQAKIKAIKE